MIRLCVIKRRDCYLKGYSRTNRNFYPWYMSNFTTAVWYLLRIDYHDRICGKELCNFKDHEREPGLSPKEETDLKGYLLPQSPTTHKP
jgi:hypothetical protein